MSFNPARYNIPFLKRLVPSFGKLVARMTWPNGFALKPSRGSLFLLHYRNFVDRQIAFYDDFERGQLDFFLDEMAKLPGGIFLDVGANIGYYSILVAAKGLARRVVAFEPDIRNRYQMEANLLLNGLVGKVELVDRAVSEKTGVISFLHYDESVTGQSRVGVGENAVELPCVALDDFLSLRGENLFLKIDIEGHEAAAIAGMKQLLAGNKVFLQVECFDENFEAFIREMAAMGLHLVHAIGNDRYFSNR